MKESIKIQIPIYHDTLHLVVGDKHDLRECLLADKISEDTVDEVVRGIKSFIVGAFRQLTEDNYFLVWLPKIPESISEYGVLIHELQHFVFFFLKDRGMEHTEDSDEAYSYLLEYVFDEIDSRLALLGEEDKQEETPDEQTNNV